MEPTCSCPDVESRCLIARIKAGEVPGGQVALHAVQVNCPDVPQGSGDRRPIGCEFRLAGFQSGLAADLRYLQA
jgi:hypothetical protein